MWITRETNCVFAKFWLPVRRAHLASLTRLCKRVIILHAAATFPGFEPVLWEEFFCEKTEKPCAIIVNNADVIGASTQ
jgi:hypothetical protein